MSGVNSTRATSAFSVATISGGVRAGARSPCHEPVRKPGRNSATAGVSGRLAWRFPPVTAISRSLPDLTGGSVASMPLNSTSACPVITSMIDCAPPRPVMYSHLMPVRCANWSPARYGAPAGLEA
ncbi:hypothetical protein D3C83_36690 [compost metagenome]